jgi:hypothetical protein
MQFETLEKMWYCPLHKMQFETLDEAIKHQEWCKEKQIYA